MTFRKDANVTGGRRATTGGSGGRIAAGGGIGSLLLIGLFLLMGGNPSEIGGMLGGGQASGPESTLEHCQTPEDGNEHADCRVDFAAQSVDQMWATMLPEQAGIEYQEPGRVVFQDVTNSGCGQATSATGPFYCPADQSAYFDVSFFDQLDRLGGTNAPLAQMYIVAHEFAHHVQQLEGTLSMSNYNDPGEDSDAVKVELQADCYAGIWIAHADKGENALLEPITEEQVQGAIDTARAVGDDNIQQRTGGEVRPDLWTHGSSEQRQNALLTGYREGNMAACDTLGVREYNV
ncbi:neutral zinc metallopeptidase [Corynebacterium sp.]|uniref:KPN_02809 family neutral zinc metallopeptidase n=1 Tax=Corynebacterium sp. TaxID=1720 RepID=UPI0026DF9BED|nr:neutral zinc metallopeptidase [Corynebacterium sp.]MDO5512104.1 neutral zinc metallopeptidase [Corynebacterium sp.]